MKTSMTMLIAATALFATSTLSGCGVLAIKKQFEAQEQLQKDMANQQSEAKRRILANQREVERQNKITAARQAYLQQTLNGHDFAMKCGELREKVDNAVIKRGSTVASESKPLFVITEWNHVSADYAQRSDYSVQKTRKASKSRYAIELKEKGAARCDVEASYQYIAEDGNQMNDRALDFEAQLLKELEPQKYAQVEAEFIAIGDQFPKEDEESAAAQN